MLNEFLRELDAFKREATDCFEKLASPADATALEAARVEFLGARSGRLKAIQKLLGQLASEEKPIAGKSFNDVKQEVTSLFAAAKERIELTGDAKSLHGAAKGSSFAQGAPTVARSLHGEAKGSSFAQGAPTVARSLHAAAAGHSSAHAVMTITKPIDVTLPGWVEPTANDGYRLVSKRRLGHLHPLTQTIEDLKQIMGRLGFSVAEGPEIEDEWHNFEALNIPAEHPARDPLENFYLATAQAAGSKSADGRPPLLLRSQTSTVQIRVMEKTPPPVRIISLGRVYRPDTADATHYPMFHQIEGLLIDRQVTMADLKSVLRLFAMSFFGGDVHIRFRPSFFPFTEPSVEVDMSWNDRWIEMGGAGMVDPHVLRAVGYDPEEVSGFAFGLGVERVCARRHQVTDIREFYRNDVRFLEQF